MLMKTTDDDSTVTAEEQSVKKISGLTLLPTVIKSRLEK
jgi:hypothetical protein